MTKKKNAPTPPPTPLPMDNISEQLKALAVPIATLTPNPKNPRTHGDQSIESIKASLKRFSQRKPIVVQREGMIVRAGNGTLQAAQELGWEMIAALVVDEADVEARAFALADNRTAELSEWIFESVSEELRWLQDDEGFDISILGWEDHEIEPLLQGDWSPPPVGEMPNPTGRAPGIHLDDEQRLTVNLAIGQMRGRSDDDSMTEGAALAAICQEWMDAIRAAAE